mmetsp:Transcript_6845/g.15607  ORF Transcript_6845/g.15607 Transcript_6845/m.15607 type:complete len:315 (-) Transcript_6845:1491-2435(-)
MRYSNIKSKSVSDVQVAPRFAAVVPSKGPSHLTKRTVDACCDTLAHGVTRLATHDARGARYQPRAAAVRARVHEQNTLQTWTLQERKRKLRSAARERAGSCDATLVVSTNAQSTANGVSLRWREISVRVTAFPVQVDANARRGDERDSLAHIRLHARVQKQLFRLVASIRGNDGASRTTRWFQTLQLGRRQAHRERLLDVHRHLVRSKYAAQSADHKVAAWRCGFLRLAHQDGVVRRATHVCDAALQVYALVTALRRKRQGAAVRVFRDPFARRLVLYRQALPCQTGGGIAIRRDRTAVLPVRSGALHPELCLG